MIKLLSQNSAIIQMSCRSLICGSMLSVIQISLPNKAMKLFLLLASLTLLFMSPTVVNACSCSGYPTACEAYANAEAVFIGSVQRVDNKREKIGDGNTYTASQTAYVQIEKAFKGVKEIPVVFHSGMSSCDPTYKEGQRWLFYAYYDKKNKVWEIRACDRSTHIESAADDLLYLQGLPDSGQKTRLSGVLEHFESDPVEYFSRIEKIIGAKVKIIGDKKSYEVYTDKNGVYEIYGLPPGQYSIEPEIPLGLKIRFPIYFGESVYSDETAKAVLKEKSCAAVNFVFSSDTSVSGKLFGADGRVLPNACLNLTPKDKTVASNWIFDCTDERGSYKMKDIPPGEYIIVVNDKGKISSDEPFPTAYYPGVFEKEKASVLTITAGDHLENYDIHIPSQEARKVIKGVLLYSDGHPVADDLVEFNAENVKEGFDGRVVAKTDAQGRFSLTILQGLKGLLHASMFIYEGDYANCPQLNKLIRASGKYDPEIETKPIRLEVNSDVQGIKLVFPFPYSCVKAKEN
jgi:hypothetical protein